MDIKDLGKISGFDSYVDKYQKADTQNIQKKDISAQQPVNDYDMEKVTEVLKSKVDKLNELFKSELNFEFNKDADMLVVKIIDKDSKEIIRQIPSEVSVKLAKALSEVEGILFDEKA